VLEVLLGLGRASIAELEKALALNRRSLQRDLKLLAELGLIREVGSGPTDPTKHYEPLL
jgi:DNA-binding Lrp family transcriptional regulator